MVTRWLPCRRQNSPRALPQRQQGETVRYAAARRARLRLDERWETFGSSTDVGENQNLAIARLEGGKLTLGIPLYTGLGIADIQVSPSDRLIAFTASLEKGSEEVGLFLTPSDRSTAPCPGCPSSCGLP